jgi:hypothetical protein
LRTSPPVDFAVAAETEARSARQANARQSSSCQNFERFRAF